MSVIVNYKAFYEDLNRTRKMRNSISWNKVAVRAGVVESGLYTFVRQFEVPDASRPIKGLSLDSFVQLLHWMRKTDMAPYIMDESDLDVPIS